MSNMDMHLRHTATARFQHSVLIMGTKTFYLHLTTNPKPQTSITSNLKKRGKFHQYTSAAEKELLGTCPKWTCTSTQLHTINLVFTVTRNLDHLPELVS
jgi:hypothetical protein